ncbi:MAG: KilA-N domain-containing protein, partial [Anaeroplasmataceae bacterium]|nr:KilA-N domain-containing protein [Anaeroplasmataceae bacterium]
MANKEVLVKGSSIRVKIINDEDYISLTDMAKTKNCKDPRFVVYSWLKSKETLRFIAIWEKLNNTLFNRVEFDTVTKDAGLNSFMISPNTLIEKCGVISIVVSAGRYNSGMFAHKDIAFEFASWISAEFKLYLIKEFQRLKKNEQKELGWTAKRELAKLNYHIHTDAIKENLIVPNLTKEQINFIYANEADLLNVALFGKTAGEWKNDNPSLKGNIRDYASIDQLLVLANMESYNAILIEQNLSQKERLIQLNQMAKS